MTYRFYFFVEKLPKLFIFSGSMKKIYLVEFNISVNVLYGLQKILLDKFPWNFYIWSAIVNDACMQKIEIGHQANFRAKYKCFLQILFPVRTILRSINFWCTDFNTDSADACILVMACVDCACPCSWKPFRASLNAYGISNHCYKKQWTSCRHCKPIKQQCLLKWNQTNGTWLCKLSRGK